MKQFKIVTTKRTEKFISFVSILSMIVVGIIGITFSSFNADSRSRATGAYPNKHTCNTSHQCVQSDSGEYNSLLACQDECGSVPGPSITPVLGRCANIPGKCVPSSQICSPATNYGQLDCGILSKCVFETAICKNAAPTATPKPSACTNISEQNKCINTSGCTWFGCANNNTGGCFKSITPRETACNQTCTSITISGLCTNTPNCKWLSCAHGGAGGCYGSETPDNIACNNQCPNYSQNDCSTVSGCKWYGCRFNDAGGCYMYGASDYDACGKACLTKSSTNCTGSYTYYSCNWYKCAHTGQGGCYQSGTSESSVCNQSCTSINLPTPCKNTSGCFWEPHAYDNNGGCFMTGTFVPYDHECSFYPVDTTCNGTLGCKWDNNCGKCKHVYEAECPTPTPNSINPTGATIIKLNSATNKTCSALCSTDPYYPFCLSIGTDSWAKNNYIMTYSTATSCRALFQSPANHPCNSVVAVTNPPNGLNCVGHKPNWTNCLCSDTNPNY
jgi:hypothetical protein